MNAKDLALIIALAGSGGGGGGGDGDITKATLAPNFSTSTAYTAGEYVWHSGKLYRFTEDHAAGSWTGTDVEEAPLSAGISELKSAIDDIEEAVITGNSWAELQAIVDKGKAAKLLPVGTQIGDEWINPSNVRYDDPWDVVHHYEDGSMALCKHYAFNDAIGFDAPEAIYYAGDGGLPAGTYYIPIGYAYGNGWVKDAAIYFTLTSAMDAGDQLFIDCGKDNKNDPAGGRSWKVFAKGSTAVKQSGTTAASGTGTELGSTSSANPHRTNGQINAPSRVVYGYGRWSQSAIRQWLNSDAAANAWWTPQNPWDRPSEQHNVRGWLAGQDPDFVAMIKPVDVVTVLNSQEGFENLLETTQDKIFLPALNEWDIAPELAGEGESWDYYEALAAEAGLTGQFQRGQTYEILKKYNVTAKTSAVAVWLRSCIRGSALSAWFGNTSGGVYSNTASYAVRGCPACIIKKST